jgi:hypothetical protein
MHVSYSFIAFRRLTVGNMLDKCLDQDANTYFTQLELDLNLKLRVLRPHKPKNPSTLRHVHQTQSTSQNVLRMYISIPSKIKNRTTPSMTKNRRMVVQELDLGRSRIVARHGEIGRVQLHQNLRDKSGLTSERTRSSHEPDSYLYRQPIGDLYRFSN